jgi:hypothetical protein
LILGFIDILNAITPIKVIKQDSSGVKVSERGLFVVLIVRNGVKSLIGYFLL